MPMPPSCAIEIARRASVTVSIAAETSGRFRRMLRERWVARLVSRGNTWENAGTNNTSSKVSALPRRRMGKAPDAKANYTDAELRHALQGRGWPCRGAAATLRTHRNPSSNDPENMHRWTALTCAAVLGALLAVPAQAQWKWRDKNGQTQYSDL